MTPTGEFQDTWLILPVFRLWDSSQSPAWKVWQVLAVPAAQPPHAVYPDWECRYLPGEGRSGSLHPHPSGRITSTECWASDSVFSPPVTKIPRHICWYHCIYCSVANICITWCQWDLRIAIAVNGSSSNVLDPVLNLSYPGIHAVAGALTAIAHNTNLSVPSIKTDREMT